jgi:hypothetical protein
MLEDQEILSTTAEPFPYEIPFLINRDEVTTLNFDIHGAQIHHGRYANWWRLDAFSKLVSTYVEDNRAQLKPDADIVLPTTVAVAVFGSLKGDLNVPRVWASNMSSAVKAATQRQTRIAVSPKGIRVVASQNPVEVDARVIAPFQQKAQEMYDSMWVSGLRTGNMRLASYWNRYPEQRDFVNIDIDIARINCFVLDGEDAQLVRSEKRLLILDSADRALIQRLAQPEKRLAV